MDRDTERCLSLYLDDQLDDKDRKAFETRLATDPELRRAVRLHRAAAEEMAAMPEMPAGLVAGARARLAERADAAGPAWWNRFWSLQTAGLVAAAAIVALVLYPFVASHDLLQSEKEPRDAIGIGGPAAREEPLQNGIGDERSGEDEEKRLQIDKLQSLGYLAGVDSETGKKPATDEDVFTLSRALQLESALRADAPKEMPDAGPAAATKTDPAAVGGTAPAAEPEPGRSRTVGQTKAEESEEVVAPDEKRKIGLRSYEEGMATSRLAVSHLAYRIFPINEATPLNESGYLVLNTDADWKRAGGSEPIDFSREMAILLPAYRASDPTIRIQVIRVETTSEGIEVWTLDVPDTAGALATRGPRQAVIITVSDAPIRLRQAD